MLLYLYGFCLAVLLLLCLATGEWDYLSFEKVTLLTFIFLLSHAALMIGGIRESDTDEESDEPFGKT